VRAKHILWIGACLLAAWMNGCAVEAAFAQAAKPAAVAADVQAVPIPPTVTEGIALQALASALANNQQQRQQLEAQLHAVEAEIAKNHPGYHFDEAMGGIVKLPPAADPAKKDPAKPEPKKK
jgi:hypothetical protein